MRYSDMYATASVVDAGQTPISEAIRLIVHWSGKITLPGALYVRIPDGLLYCGLFSQEYRLQTPKSGQCLHRSNDDGPIDTTHIAYSVGQSCVLGQGYFDTSTGVFDKQLRRSLSCQFFWHEHGSSQDLDDHSHRQEPGARPAADSSAACLVARTRLQSSQLTTQRGMLESF